MEKDKMNNFIENLSKEAGPVKRLMHPFKRFLIWLAVSFLCLSVSISFLGIKHDLSLLLTSTRFLIETTLLLVSAFFAALSAFYLAIPGEERSKKKYLVFVSLFLWVISLVGYFIYSVNQMGFSSAIIPGTGIACVAEILGIGFPPAFVLFFMIKKGRTTRPVLTGIVVMLAAFSLSTFALQFTCHNDTPAHLFLYHFLPIVILGSCGMFIGRKLLKW